VRPQGAVPRLAPMGPITGAGCRVAAATGLLLAVLSAQALGALPIAPAHLALPRRDLPGFAHAERFTETTTSPFTWAHTTGFGTWTAEQEEVSLLEGSGFLEGVETAFRSRRHARGGARGAVAQVAVFATAAAAVTETLRSVAAGAAEDGPSVVRFAAPAIPGAAGVAAAIRPPHRGGAANVFFSTGRCAIVVGEGIAGARRTAQLERAPRAGALALYRRARSACA
jgi:hypothetical protein